jgi:ArsR family transcriptional regulator
MKALAHPVRLQILELLEQEGEACVCHLEAHLNQRQAYISQQLGRLRDAGLVRDRREGLNVYYALSSEAISLLLEQAKRAASAISSTQGAELKFKPISAAKLDDCACPKCQQAIARVEVG